MPGDPERALEEISACDLSYRCLLAPNSQQRRQARRCRGQRLGTDVLSRFDSRPVPATGERYGCSTAQFRKPDVRNAECPSHFADRRSPDEFVKLLALEEVPARNDRTWNGFGRLKVARVPPQQLIDGNRLVVGTDPGLFRDIGEHLVRMPGQDVATLLGLARSCPSAFGGEPGTRAICAGAGSVCTTRRCRADDCHISTPVLPLYFLSRVGNFLLRYVVCRRERFRGVKRFQNTCRSKRRLADSSANAAQ